MAEQSNTGSTNTAIVAVLAIAAISGTVIFMKKKESAEMEYADYQPPETETNVNITTYPGLWPWPIYLGRPHKYRSNRWWWRDRVSDWYYLPKERWRPNYYSPRYPPRHSPWPSYYHDWYGKHPGPAQSKYPIPGGGGRTGGQPISWGEGTRGISQ